MIAFALSRRAVAYTFCVKRVSCRVERVDCHGVGGSLLRNGR